MSLTDEELSQEDIEKFLQEIGVLPPEEAGDSTLENLIQELTDFTPRVELQENFIRLPPPSPVAAKGDSKWTSLWICCALLGAFSIGFITGNQLKNTSASKLDLISQQLEFTVQKMKEVEETLSTTNEAKEEIIEPLIEVSEELIPKKTA
ncbi:MAG: hypothetical protein ACKVOH_00220 [Chlamydiales bacterium]